MIRVLVVDDDPNARSLIETFCRDEEYELAFAANGKEAIEKIQKGIIHIVVTDIRMPELGGEAVLDTVRRLRPDVPVIIMTSYGSIEDAVNFLQAGAHDYIAKPLTKEVFCHRIHRAIEKLNMSREISRLKTSLKKFTDREHVVGNSISMQKIMQKLPSIAQTDASVVVYGESGTGKELVARTIHYLSRRSAKPFIPVNCGALPENLLESELFGYKRGAFTDAHADTPGLVEEANTGTLFLDEIGEISPRVQVKLLRFLQEKEIKPLGSTKIIHTDVRIISATNRDLQTAIAAGSFREDLFYRLNIVPLTLPTLRERREDIPLLANHFLRRFAKEFDKEVHEFSPKALLKLQAYEWPGNIRELENKIQQVVVMGSGAVIQPEDLELPSADKPAAGAPGMEPSRASGKDSDSFNGFKAAKRRVVGQFEMDYVARALALHDGNISRAAKAAGMDRKNFWQLMRKYNLSAHS
jgi:DNA-binding NtrC family response regulator